MNEYLKKLFEQINVEVIESIEDIEILPGDIYILGIAREAVEKGHIESYLKEFEKLSRKKMRGRVILTFAGYENDKREIYQIPEIRKWMDRLLKNVPHLFYFLSKENYAIVIAFLCLGNVHSRTGDQVALQQKESKALIEKITKSAVSHSKKCGDSAGIQFRLANTIMEQTGYEKIQ